MVMWRMVYYCFTHIIQCVYIYTYTVIYIYILLYYYIILYYTILYYIISYHIILYHIILYYIISYYIILYHIILYYIISYYIISYYIISYHIISYHIILYHIISYIYIHIYIYTRPIACYRSPWLPIAPGLPPPESAVSPHCRSPAATGAVPVVGLRNASGGGGLVGKMYGKTMEKNMGKPLETMENPWENQKKTSGKIMDPRYPRISYWELWIITDHISFLFWALSMIFLC